MNPSLHFQLSGDAGTYQALTAMRTLVNKTFFHPWIRERAAEITRSCNRDRTCEEQALNGWVNRVVQYVRDPANIEALHDPVTFYEARIRKKLPVFGDCDDMTIYLAALLKSIGHQPTFRVLGQGPYFSHVHVRCHGQNLDPSLKIGKEPRHALRAIQVKI
jgi:hypothetical protein